jgi:hypothetical protein
MKSEFTEKFNKAYTSLYLLHPSVSEEDFRFRYLRVDWFFPNHLNNVLKQIKKIGKKYFSNIDYEVSLFAGLFHDSGLVYKREATDTSGHEDRSIEYAKMELKKLGYNDVFISKVVECIQATNVNYNSTMPEANLVRNADAYAHLISMHFFAKANFSNSIGSFINWFEKKIQGLNKKINIPEIHEEISPLIHYYEQMIKNYRNNQGEKDFLDIITRDI